MNDPVTRTSIYQPPLNDAEIGNVMMLAVLGKEPFENVILRGVADTPEHRAEYAATIAWVKSLPPGSVVDIPFVC